MISVFVWMIASAMTAQPAAKDKSAYEFDPADEIVRAAMVSGEHSYEPHVAALNGKLWLTWLEFEPGKGDRIWVGCRDIAGGDWLSRDAVTLQPGTFRNPTLTVDISGGLWLSVEQQKVETWLVNTSRLDLDRDNNTLNTSSPGWTPALIGTGINHRTAADLKDGIWIAQQNDQFQILVSHVTGQGIVTKEIAASFPAGHAWHPDIIALPDGDIVVTFDASEGKQSGFDTYLVRRHEGKWSPIQVLAASDAFEARTRVIGDSDGRVWALWEEGNRNWGQPYRAMMRKISPTGLVMADDNGPLHAFRWLHLNELIGAGRSPVSPPLPMPAIDKLALRADAPKGVEYLGGFYEHGELAIDGMGRLWLVYRHFYVPFQGVKKVGHVQQDWGMYARCFDGQAWSKLFRCDAGHGDGMQRLSVAALPDGIALTYCTGRTDRRPSDSPVKIALATIHLPGESRWSEQVGTVAELPVKEPAAVAKTIPPEMVNGLQLVFGDLHRHTDLSLCDVPVDGTIEDNYRYAIGAAELDFMGITDHSRDIAQGKEKSLLWWRCRKEVSRHTLAPQFIGMYAYEHSRSGEDHNVISLRPDMLVSDEVPFPKLWANMDGDTFTIPHQTICKPIPPSGEMPLGLTEKTWSYGDNAHRPLLEIYQGCRDRAIENDAHLGLSKGHIMGFIASSDHMSTAASYAGVWTPQRSREAIFRAMQARRTFGATAKISLRMMMGKHWMGEQVHAADLGPVQVRIVGTDTIENVDVIVDGQVAQSLPQDGRIVELDLPAPAFENVRATSAGLHYFYIRMRQADGNQAWSSPIWVKP